MPTIPEMNKHTRRTPFLSLLIALVFIASACSLESDISAAESETEAFDVELSPDGPQYGDSLDEFADASETPSSASPPPEGFTEIDWETLIPPGSSGAEISARFDERIAAVEPGTPEADAVFAELQAEYGNQPANVKLAGQDILLAGFIAPLTYSGDLITEFLLVPYFGACIHVPPPPPNQTVMVTLADGEGLRIDDSWGPIWVTGTMAVDSTETDLATAGYSIPDAQAGVHSET